MRRRHERGVQTAEPATGVLGVRTPRIALQIGPIGVGRIGQPGAPPGDGLAAHGDHGANALGIGRIGEGVEEIGIGDDRVLLQRGAIGLIDRIVADRPRPHIGLGFERHGGRRRARRAGEQHGRRRQFRFIPGNLRALGLFRNPKPCAGKGLIQRQAAFAQHFGQRLGIDAIGAGFVGGDRVGRGVEGDEFAIGRLNQGEAAGERRAGLGEGVDPRRVEHDDARFQRHFRQRLQIIVQPHRLQRHIGGAWNRRVDRREIVLAGILHAPPAQIDENDGVRPGGGGLVEEFAQAAAQAVLIEVGGAGHVEAGLLQCVGDQAGVIGGGGKRAGLVGRLADHQSDSRRPARRRLRGARRRADEKGAEDQGACGEPRFEKSGFARHACPPREFLAPREIEKARGMVLFHGNATEWGLNESRPFPGRILARSALDDNPRADSHAVIKVDHIIVRHSDTARRHGLADRVRLVRAMNAEHCAADVNGPRPERIANAALHMARQVGTAADHLRGRRPARPFALVCDLMRARPFEAWASDADAISQRLAVSEHIIEPPLRGRNDDRAGPFVTGIGHGLARNGGGARPRVARRLSAAEKVGEEIRPRRSGAGQGKADDSDDFGQMDAKGKTTQHRLAPTRRVSVGRRGPRGPRPY